MSTETPLPEAATPEPKRNRWLSGVALIVIGVLLLAGQFIKLPSFGQLFLPALGLVFILWGIFTRSGGLLVPGGILTGIGVGTYLSETLALEGEAEPGIFLVVFGAGFALITLLSVLFTPDKHYWALIPGGILALIGAALLVGGASLDILEAVGKVWPVALILLGVYVIFKKQRTS